MILQAPPGAPPIVHLAAAAILYSHIGGAVVGMISGGVAMIARKGGPAHRWAGHVFFVAMLAMAGIGAAVAPFLSEGQAPNTLAGTFTFYLVATGWATVRRKPGEIGRFETGALFLALGVVIGALALALGWIAAPQDASSPPVQVFFVFAAGAGLAAACDVRVIAHGGVAGAPRLRRHLWRMSVALFIAAGSFAAQPKAIPPFLHGSPLVDLPMVAVPIAMIFWLVRLGFRGAIRPDARSVRTLPSRRSGGAATRADGTSAVPGT